MRSLAVNPSQLHLTDSTTYQRMLHGLSRLAEEISVELDLRTSTRRLNPHPHPHPHPHPYPHPEPTQVPIACERRLSAQKRVELLTPPLESFVHAEGALRV